MDALGPVLFVAIPVVSGALAWLFYREYLTSDSFWIVVIALVIAGIVFQAGYVAVAALIAIGGIVLWLWIESRSREE